MNFSVFTERYLVIPHKNIIHPEFNFEHTISKKKTKLKNRILQFASKYIEQKKRRKKNCVKLSFKY